MIDINDFDAIRIGLASPQADPRLVVGRGHEAGDHQLPHPEARARRALLRAHLRSDEGLGVLLRQVQARPLQGDHLRALRRRGDAAEGAPRAHGSHRPRRAGLAHLVLQGRPEPHRLPARHRPARAREGALLRRLDRHGGRRRGARGGPRRPRGQGQGRVGADLRRPRRAARRARAAAPRRRDYFAKGKDKGFDEDDEFWARGLANWAEEQVLPTLEEARTLAGGDLPRARRHRSRPRTRRRSASSSARRRPATTGARPARARVGRDGRAADPARRSSRSAPSSRRRPARRRARSRSTSTSCSTRCSAGDELTGRRRRARRRRRREEPREGARGRQRPARRRARSAPSRPTRPTRTCASSRTTSASTEGARKDDLDIVRPVGD